MKKIVLIVEDSAQLLSIYEKKISAEGFEVLIARTGNEGLNLIKTSNPNLVILDVMLPGGMNGFDVMEQIMKDEKLKTIPVLMLTNLDSEEKVARTIGVKEYLIKANTSLETIVAKVHQYIQ